jgi:uncharacterized protein (PEP-CTERM system associated)
MNCQEKHRTSVAAQGTTVHTLIAEVEQRHIGFRAARSMEFEGASRLPRWRPSSLLPVHASERQGLSDYSRRDGGVPRAARRRGVSLSLLIIGLISTRMLSLPRPARAAEWLVTPSLNLRETYSDNINLGPPGAQNNDWVTEADPTVDVIGTGSRLKVRASYTMQNLLYKDETSADRTNNLLNAGGNAKLVDEFLFLDGNASVSRSTVSLFGPQSPNNIYVTGNQASVANYSISPYIAHSIGNLASYQLRYTRNEFKTGVSGLSDTIGNGALLDLNSGDGFGRLGWGLHYSDTNTEYSYGPSILYRTSSGNVGFRVTPTFSLTGTKGYEKYTYVPSIGNTNLGGFWTAGFSWAPSERTSVQATTGERFFGKTNSLVASHHSRNTLWSLNYNESITTTSEQFVLPVTINTASYLTTLWAPIISDPVLLQQIVTSFIQNNGLPSSLASSVNYFTNGVFLQKLWQASAAIDTAKSTFILGWFRASRDTLTAQSLDSQLLGSINPALNDFTKQIGGNAMWTWRFSARTNVNARAQYAKNSSLSTGLEDNVFLTGLGMTTQFKSKLFGAVDLRRSQQNSNLPGTQYLERAITVSLLMKF